MKTNSFEIIPIVQQKYQQDGSLVECLEWEVLELIAACIIGLMLLQELYCP